MELHSSPLVIRSDLSGPFVWSIRGRGKYVVKRPWSLASVSPFLDFEELNRVKMPLGTVTYEPCQSDRQHSCKSTGKTILARRP